MGEKIKYLSLFSGIGSPETALKRIGMDYDLIGFSEIDKYAIKSYCAIHQVSESLNLGDISKIDISQLPTEIDLVTHGSPCQDFSIAGKNLGGEQGSGTRSSLLWHTIDICKVVKPKYIVWENVKNVISEKHRHIFEKYLSELEKVGYKNYYKVLNSKDFGIPQNRERIFVISIRNDINISFKFTKGAEVKDLEFFLENNVSDTFKFTEEREKMMFSKTSENVLNSIFNSKELLVADFRTDEGIRIRKNGLVPTLSTMQGGHRQPFIIKDKFIRKLTPLECWKLMGFTEEEFKKAEEVNSNSQLYKQAGNSIVVNVLEEIFKNLFKEDEK